MTHADAATGRPTDPPRADQPTSHTPDARANGHNPAQALPPRDLDAYRQGCLDQRAADREHLADLLAGLADAHADIDAAWQRVGTLTREQRISRDHATMREQADRINTALGRPPGYTYRGGPVDWHTGKPLTTSWRAAA